MSAQSVEEIATATGKVPNRHGNIDNITVTSFAAVHYGRIAHDDGASFDVVFAVLQRTEKTDSRFMYETQHDVIPEMTTIVDVADAQWDCGDELNCVGKVNRNTCHGILEIDVSLPLQVLSQ